MIRRDRIDWRLVGRLGFVLLAITILPVLFGILLDHRLHTTPIITLAMMFIGFNLGIVTIYRHISAVFTQISPPDPVAVEHAVAGDAAGASQGARGAVPKGHPEHFGGDPC